jgi:putative spermidine/putrescine transport system substrate-binding protein
VSRLAPLRRRAAEPVECFTFGESALSLIWSPSVVTIKAQGLKVCQAFPEESYRAWHCGLCLARHLDDQQLDMAYACWNWFLDGWAGANMAR